MVKSDLEKFVRRLFGDEGFKALALHSPERAIGEYRLTRAEQAAARKLCTRMVTPEGMMLAATPNSIWY